jgi:hypothetical protein
MAVRTQSPRSSSPLAAGRDVPAAGRALDNGRALGERGAAGVRVRRMREGTMTTRRSRRDGGQRQDGEAAPAPSGRGTEAAWARLDRALAETLAALGSDRCLVLSAKRRGYFVQVLALGDEGVRAEAVSNAWLRPRHALDAQRLSRLAALGWSAPTLTRAEFEAFDGNDESVTPPAGSTNHVRTWEHPAPFAAIAALVLATLREVYGIRRPDQLEYTAFGPGPREILLPSLGLECLPFDNGDEEDGACGHEHADHLLRPEDPAELLSALVDALKACTELDEPTVDEDGDIPLRYGSALIVLRVADDAPYVMMASPLVTGVPPSAELHDTLNELSRTHRLVRFYHADGTVHAALDLVADPFVPDHLEAALAVMGSLCDELGPELQHRLGGTTAFEPKRHARPRRRKQRYN